MKKYKKLKRIKLSALGIDALTGKLLMEPKLLGSFSPIIAKNLKNRNLSYMDVFSTGVSLDKYNFDRYNQNLREVGEHLDDIQQAGWGVIINKKDKKLEKVLKPLIEKRKGRVIYYNGEEPYKFADKLNIWDGRHTNFPYYLLIAGAIQSIPLKLQYLLDIRFSVGRLYFDKIYEYESYIEKLLSYESHNTNSILFFAPTHSQNDPTNYSRKYLVEPLVDILKNNTDNTVDVLLKGKATEENLFKMMNKKRYSVLFTATHGLGLPKEYPNKESFQGAIVCQDAQLGSNLIENNKGIITGQDIEKGKELNCDVLFMFGCYTAGTLQQSDYKFWVDDEVRNSLEIYEAKKDFIAYLPQKALASEKGPLSIIAHIDPAWVFSFMNEYQTEQRIEPFRNSLKRILAGVTVGRSVRDFNLRYSSLSAALLNYVIDHLERGEELNPLSISNIWVTRQDAQNYILLGDPAFSI